MPTRLRLDDDEHLDEVLSLPPQPSHLLRDWSIDGVLPGIYMREFGPEA